MQVHARARLTPKGRLFVVKRVLEQGWSVTAADRGRRRHRAKGLALDRPLSLRGRVWPRRPLLGPEANPAPNPGRERVTITSGFEHASHPVVVPSRKGRIARRISIWRRQGAGALERAR